MDDFFNPGEPAAAPGKFIFVFHTFLYFCAVIHYEFFGWRRNFSAKFFLIREEKNY